MERLKRFNSACLFIFTGIIVLRNTIYGVNVESSSVSSQTSFNIGQCVCTLKATIVKWLQDSLTNLKAILQSFQNKLLHNPKCTETSLNQIYNNIQWHEY